MLSRRSSCSSSSCWSPCASRAPRRAPGRRARRDHRREPRAAALPRLGRVHPRSPRPARRRMHRHGRRPAPDPHGRPLRGGRHRGPPGGDRSCRPRLAGPAALGGHPGDRRPLLRPRHDARRRGPARARRAEHRHPDPAARRRRSGGTAERPRGHDRRLGHYLLRRARRRQAAALGGNGRTERPHVHEPCDGLRRRHPAVRACRRPTRRVGVSRRQRRPPAGPGRLGRGLRAGGDRELREPTLLDAPPGRVHTRGGDLGMGPRKRRSAGRGARQRSVPADGLPRPLPRARVGRSRGRPRGGRRRPGRRRAASPRGAALPRGLPARADRPSRRGRPLADR
jgi:hypothetical protein